MTYRVIITAGALAHVKKYIDYLAIEKVAPLTAKRWWQKAIAETESLTTFPRRCPLAPKNGLRDYTIRALRVGSQLFLYRIDEP